MGRVKGSKNKACQIEAPVGYFPTKKWLYLYMNKEGEFFKTNPDKKTKRIPTIYIDKDGYERIWCIRTDGKLKYVLKHRIIMENLFPDDDHSMTVNHKDGNKRNNHPSNFEWMSAIDNNKHSFKVLGRKGLRGEMCGLAKLNSKKVLEIRKLFDENIPRNLIVKKYKISPSQVQRIGKRKNWQHLK